MLEQNFEKSNYKQFKEALAELLIEKLQPVQEKRKELLENAHILPKILEEGAEKARKKTSETLREVYEKIGLAIS